MPQSRRIESDVTLLRIVESLMDREGAGITAVADDVGIAKSTAHAHLAALDQEGYVRTTDGEYHLALRFLDLGTFVRNQQKVFRHSRAVVDELAEETGERVWCVTMENGKVSYLYEAIGEHSITSGLHTGEKMDPYCLSGGKAVLAFLPENRRNAIITESDLERHTVNTICDPEVLKHELDRIQEEGVAYNYEESTIGLHAVGAPVRDQDNTVIGSLSMSGPANRFTKERMETELREMILSAANEVEINIRHS